jgi:hypothetical protein
VRCSSSPGDAAKLLFDIETKENGRVIDRGVDRMWVIIKTKTKHGYVGVLDSNPGFAENLNLREGSKLLSDPSTWSTQDIRRETMLSKNTVHLSFKMNRKVTL